MRLKANVPYSVLWSSSVMVPESLRLPRDQQREACGRCKISWRQAS